MSSFKTFQQTIAAKALDASHVEAFFERAHAAFGTIAWPDGIDLAPEEVWVRTQKAAC